VSLDSRNFSALLSSYIRDHGHICSPSLTQMSLCSI
jgi:hypothetical protein